jgi:hypothetical protein
MKPKIDCFLNVNRSESDIVANLRFENHSQVAFSIPRWTLLTDGEMTWAAFEVTRDSDAVPYDCKTIKRGEPMEDDLVVLHPEGTFETATVISLCYDFAQHGEYSVRYRAYVSEPNGKELLEINSEAVTVVVQ